MLIEAKQVAEIYKLNDNGRSAQKWAKDGSLKATKDGKKWLYEIDDVIQFGYENGYIQISMNDKDKLTPKVRKDLADAELKEFKLAVEKGKYYSKEELDRQAIYVATTVRNKFLAMPTRIAPVLAGNDNLGEIESIMSSYINTVLEELHKLGSPK